MTPEIPNLTMMAPPRFIPDAALLDSAASRLGLRLPPSYRSFAGRYGHGLTAGLLRLHVPLLRTSADDLVVASKDLAEMIQNPETEQRSAGSCDEEEGEDEDAWKEEEGEEEAGRRLRHLVPFGSTQDGLVLAWDPTDVATEDGELWIYLVPSGGRRPIRAAPDLGTLLHTLLDTQFRSPFIAGSQQLAWTFEPEEPARSRADAPSRNPSSRRGE